MTKRKHIVMARTPEAIENGLDTTKGHLDFKPGQSMLSVDEGLAQEIDAVHGLNGGSADVWVDEDPVATWHEKHDRETVGHKRGTHYYMFGPTQKYAAAWEAFEQRRKDKTSARYEQEAIDG